MCLLQPPNCKNYTSDECEIDPMEIRFINTELAPNQISAEKILSNMFDITEKNPDCHRNATDFFCKATYHTCHYSEIDLIPMAHECAYLQKDVCKDEWTQLESVSPTMTCCNFYDPNFACPDQFARFCGVCAPLCSEFSQNGEATTLAIDVIIGISMILGNFIFGIIVFIAAFIKRKTM